MIWSAVCGSDVGVQGHKTQEGSQWDIHYAGSEDNIVSVISGGGAEILSALREC